MSRSDRPGARAALVAALSVLPLLLLTGLGCRQADHPVADLIVTNGTIWTGHKAQPIAEAMAVVGDRVAALGTAPEIDAWNGDHTQVVDAAGRLVVPGFNDAHLHFLSGGLQIENVNLKDAPSREEFVRRLAEHAKTLPPGEWITGSDWDEQSWDPPVLPDAALIDAATPVNPVYIDRYDGHMSLANTLAMRLAKIDPRIPEIPGGKVDRDARGRPTGLFRDAADVYIRRAVPPLGRERRLRAIRKALDHAASVGVTSAQDMNPEYDDIALYAELLERGELTTRIYAAPRLGRWKEQALLGLRHAFGSPWLRVGALKGYADGSLGSRTAYFFEPFIDDPSRGLLSDEMHPIDAMRERLMGADAAGLQICVHAIGDEGISILLDLYEEVEKAHGPADRRLRVEHAQHMAAKDFDRFAALGVIASMQPYHAIDDGRWAASRIGPDRAGRTYAFRTFIDHKVRLAFGTDWNVAPLDPMQTVYAAVTRATIDGKHPDGWFPEQKLSVAEAVTAYTQGSAYAEFQEKDKGTLAPGMLADLVILSGDIFRIDPVKIRDVKVVTTIAGGRVVWPR